MNELYFPKNIEEQYLQAIYIPSQLLGNNKFLHIVTIRHHKCATTITDLHLYNNSFGSFLLLLFSALVGHNVQFVVILYCTQHQIYICFAENWVHWVFNHLSPGEFFSPECFFHLDFVAHAIWFDLVENCIQHDVPATLPGSVLCSTGCIIPISPSTSIELQDQFNSRIYS